jgi:hypothetical protein
MQQAQDISLKNKVAMLEIKSRITQLSRRSITGILWWIIIWYKSTSAKTTQTKSILELRKKILANFLTHLKRATSDFQRTTLLES